jgi:hypothetical protein
MGVPTTRNVNLRLNKTLFDTLFSPISKEADKLQPKEKQEIDVLIATDCISEGQNLQDCDYLMMGSLSSIIFHRNGF